MKFNLGTLAIALASLPVLFWRGRNLPWTPMRWVGLILMLTGLVLLAVARIQLGRAFSLRAKATQLVTTGLYSRIRNPIYLFSGVAVVGMIFWIGRPLYLLVFLAIVPAQVWRAGKEARVLRERFGSAYEEYRKRTWF